MVKYQKESAVYEMKLDSANKVLHLTASGFFSEVDGQAFLNHYEEIVKTFPVQEYALVIEAPDLKPSSPKVADMLGILLTKYIEVPFRKRLLVTEGNAIAISQFKRLGASIPGWTEGVVYVDDYQTALNAAKG